MTRDFPAPGVPEGWPPPGAGTSERTVPMFPLPNVWLMPGAIMPLHIFEPRYREMIEDSLDGPGRLVIGTVVEGHESELAGTPPVHETAGLGEIGRHERLPDGRFLILLVGLARVRVREVESERSYRLVCCEKLEEVLPPEPEATRLRRDLKEAICARNQEKGLDLPEEMPVGHLADLLILRLPLAHDLRQSLYSDLECGSRARAALKAHETLPIVPPPG